MAYLIQAFVVGILMAATISETDICFEGTDKIIALAVATIRIIVIFTANRNGTLLLRDDEFIDLIIGANPMVYFVCNQSGLDSPGV